MALEKQVVLEKHVCQCYALESDFFHPTTHIPVLMKITAIKFVCFVSAQLAFYC